MIAFLNGKFIEEGQATVSVFDRGFLYGDGLFEAFRVFNGKLFRWDAHLLRFHRGVGVLNIRLPFSNDELRIFATELVSRNKMTDALLRLTLTRGPGLRGYSPRGADHPTTVMTLHPVPRFEPGKPEGWRLIVSNYRLPANEPLAAFKTCNKLQQVMARSEADRSGAEEAILLNYPGRLVEGSSSNLFWVKSGTLRTPPVPAGILPGVTRLAVLELCRKRGIKVEETDGWPDDLHQAEGVFLSLTSFGIVEGLRLDGETLQRWPLLGTLHADYCDLLMSECA
jgi:branched-chain amino acid aminotransferase